LSSLIGVVNKFADLCINFALFINIRGKAFARIFRAFLQILEDGDEFIFPGIFVAGAERREERAKFI